jgi:hypothetical protein
MTRIGGRATSHGRFLPWFAGLPAPAKAGIVTAVLVMMSAGVLIGVPPSRMPWLPPTVAPQGSVQTPSVLKPSMVEAATPSARTSPTVRTGELVSTALTVVATSRLVDVGS